MAINFSPVPGAAMEPKNYMMYRLPGRNLVKMNAFEHGEKVAIEFDIKHFLDFNDLCGIVADYVTRYQTPLPVTRMEALELAMNWTARHGTFTGLDLDKINRHTVYGVTVKIASLFADFFPLNRVPNNLLVQPKGYDKTKVQYVRPRVLHGCQANTRNRKSDNSGWLMCLNLEDYIIEIQGRAIELYPWADNKIVRVCTGHRTQFMKEDWIAKELRVCPIASRARERRSKIYPPLVLPDDPE